LAVGKTQQWVEIAEHTNLELLALQFIYASTLDGE